MTCGPRSMNRVNGLSLVHCGPGAWVDGALPCQRNASSLTRLQWVRWRIHVAEVVHTWRDVAAMLAHNDYGTLDPMVVSEQRCGRGRRGAQRREVTGSLLNMLSLPGKVAVVGDEDGGGSDAAMLRQR